jgi:hypothetical protein
MSRRSLDAQLENLEDVTEEDAAEIKRKSIELRKILDAVSKKRALAAKQVKQEREELENEDKKETQKPSFNEKLDDDFMNQLNTAYTKLDKRKKQV